MTTEVASVFIVDDDMSIREGLRNLLRSIGLKAETFGTAQEFLGCKRPDGPGCLVLDVRLPGLSGLDLQRELADANIDIPIVFITAHGDVPMSVRAMKQGAVDFLTKPFRDQDFIDAIQVCLNRSKAARERRAELGALQKRYESLSPREQQVFSLVVRGLLNKQIGAELGVSEATVKLHRGRLTQKMGADSLADLIQMANALGNRPGTIPGGAHTA